MADVPALPDRVADPAGGAGDGAGSRGEAAVPAASGTDRDAERNARPFPERVPVLVDRVSGVRLRAHQPDDVARIVEQCRDPDTIRWTTVPTPAGGYSPADAEEFLGLVATGWQTGRQLCWAIEDADRPGVFCGSIDLRLEGAGLAEVGFALHPDARGRHLMAAALRLVRDHGFDAAGLQVLHWRAAVGNWASRRVAARAGFRVEGLVRRSLVHRGERLDGWVATMTATDERAPVPWLDPPELTGRTVRLRPFTETDADRIAAASADPLTQHWLVSLPRRYGREQALAYLEQIRELGASATGLTWCVADAVDDRCLGGVSLDGFGGYARRAEIGYWSHPAARGRGATTEAVRLVTDHAESTGLVDSLLIRVAAGNHASRRVATAAGYRELGVLARAEPLGDGSLDDLVHYARP